MQSYPAQLQYNNINPKGFFSTFKQWTIQPLASGGVFWPGQNVKILIQSLISGVMDPYRSHLQFEVQIDSQLNPVGLLQLDSSAQSFIQQLVISSRNKQIQRIPQYSVLAAWLTDIGLSELYAQGRQTQGLGYTNVQSLNNFSKQSVNYNSTTTSQITSKTGSTYQVSGLGTMFPTQTSSVVPCIGSYGAGGNVPKFLAAKNAKGHVNIYNPAWLQSDVYQQSQWWTKFNPNDKSFSTASLNQTGYNKNMRAQYLQSIQSCSYPQSTQSFSTYQVNLDKSVLHNDQNATWDNGQKYLTDIPQYIRHYGKINSNSTDGINTGLIPNTTNLTGYSTLYSPNFCKGVNQPFISSTVPQCQMRNGLILPKKIPISKKTFKVPIISAIIGLLIPQDQFVLLPIKALNQLLLEFVVDKYAMFTSGYNDISQFDVVGMKLQQQRAFTIKRVFYKMHTYQFYAPEIDQYLNRALMDRIVLNCNMWTLGNQYQVIKGQNLNNSWPVACTSQALNQIVVLFVPLDYQIYSFCRKHFRLSNNITKFQLRINMDYYPSQPILGNGGNPMIIQNLDNSAFIQQIFWSNNFMFNKVNPWPRINAYNFAINQRCYDITNKNPMYDLKMRNNYLYQWKNESVNSDTALGMPFVHQNRYVGKAGYVFGFQPYAHSAYHLTGIDCRQVRQFDVLLSTNPQDNFTRQQTMYIFTRSSVIVEYTDKGINVYGR